MKNATSKKSKNPLIQLVKKLQNLYAEFVKFYHADPLARARDLYNRIDNAVEPEGFDGEWSRDVPPSPNDMVRRPIRIGVATFGIFFGTFFIWAISAQLSSAAIALGIVTVNTNRKEVQHLEGGIVKNILISEGSRVREGDVLLRLDDTSTSAGVDLILGQYRSILAQVASLTAEQQDSDRPKYPEELIDYYDEQEVQEIIESQNNLFVSRRQSLQGQIDVLQQQVKQFEEEITGLEAQRASEATQLNLIREEIVGVQELFDKGLERKPRLLALQRQLTEIEGRVGQYQAEIARAKQSMLENELNIRDLINRNKTSIAEQLREAETERADLAERLRALENQQERTEIVAPRSDIVVNLTQHTIGGVIQPGQTVLEIVPIEDTLIVEARVNPRDIDVVHAGLPAQVVLTAYNTRQTPYLDATVRRVSADIFRDKVTGENYYQARVEVDLTKLEEFLEIALYPGMPVEVMIVTGNRTAWSYLTAPFNSTLRKGVREL